MLKYYLQTLLVLFLLNGVYAQDVRINAVIGPLSGCDLTSTQVVGVVVQNSSSTPNPIPGGSITVKYKVNGGPTVAQSLGTLLATGATWNFNFSVTADLSACDTDFNIVTWVEYAADINPNNDTLAFTVRNDCTIIPGQVNVSETVCAGNNGNTLNLVGWQNGTITNWSFSEDNGITWTSISNTTTSHVYNNLTDNTLYAVEIDGGYCVDNISGIGTITVQSPAVGGTLTGPSALCISNASGTVSLTGNSPGVLDWESSTDNGVTWSGIGNITTSEVFTGLTQTTVYRALIDGGVCPNAFSDTHEVYIEQASSAGVLEKDTVLCENEAVDLILATSVGSLYEWESSPDGITWTPIVIANPSSTYNTGSLTLPTHYRAGVTNGICPSDLSNEVFVDIQPDITAGTIAGAVSTCVDNASGTLTLTGNTANILRWESSINNGANWTSIANTTPTEVFTNLTQTTWYRALIEGGFCADKYSDTAFVTVWPFTVAGTLSAAASICEGVPYTLNLTGNIGTVESWESSLDGNTWSTINSTDSSYTIPSVTVPNYYRVIVKSGMCVGDTSNVIFVNVLPAPTADAGTDVTILEGETVELNGSGGLLGMWSADSTLSDSTIYNPIASPIETTTYYLTVINADGCFDTDFVTITVGLPIPDLNVKNVITPNGDGFNDTWIVEGLEGFPNIAVKVYNIYGVLVFQEEDYKNDWKGDFNNKRLPNGTYLYVVMPGGTKDILKGNLTILGDE